MPITKQCHIVAVKISAMPKTLFDPMPVVEVRLDGEEDYQVLFSYYPDEISFNAGEFLGLTLDEAHHMKFGKDKQFLTT